jgi:hypothetical protein
MSCLYLFLDSVRLFCSCTQSMYTTPYLINTLLAGMLQSSVVEVLSLKSVVMDMLVCEVEQPPSISRVACSSTCN